MEIVGRLTADAVTRTVQGGRKCVGFSLAVNDSFRSGADRKEVTNFFECSYWRNEGIAKHLKKGGLVQVYGRVGVNAYLAKDGGARGVLTFYVSEIKLFGGAAQNVEGNKVQESLNPNEHGDSQMEHGGNSERAIKPSPAFDDVPEIENNDLPFQSGKRDE